MPRRRSGLLAGLLITAAAGAVVACGGDSPLDIVPTSTVVPTAAVQPTSAPQASPTVGIAPTETPATSGGQQEYTVQDGDTLGAIAVQFDVTVDALIQANSITDANLIVPGETLIIPAAQ